MSFLFVFLSFWRKQYIGAFAYVRPAWFIADAQWVGLVSLLCLLTEWLVIPRRTLHSRRGTKRTVDYWYHSFVMPFYYSVWAPVVKPLVLNSVWMNLRACRRCVYTSCEGLKAPPATSRRQPTTPPNAEKTTDFILEPEERVAGCGMPARGHGRRRRRRPDGVVTVWAVALRLVQTYSDTILLYPIPFWASDVTRSLSR